MSKWQCVYLVMEGMCLWMDLGWMCKGREGMAWRGVGRKHLVYNGACYMTMTNKVYIYIQEKNVEAWY